MSEDGRPRIGPNVKRLRTLRKWGQAELAAEAGLTTQTISNVETGRHDASLETAAKIAKALGVGVAELYAAPAPQPAPARAPYSLDDFIADRERLGAPLTESDVEILRTTKFRGKPDSAEKWGKIYRILCLEDE